MSDKVKVLVVDDSFLMRRIISDIVNSDPHLEVVGKAKDGAEALEKVVSLNPDVVTLDINLPIKNGLEVLEDIIKTKPTKVIMLSAYTRAGASATIRALELGAVDFIAKPSGEISLGLEKLKNEIIEKIKLAANFSLDKYMAVISSAGAAQVAREQIAGAKRLVIIGASTGGPKAILTIMKSIPEDIKAAFLIVQHMPKGFTLSFAERISWETGIRAKEAEEGDTVNYGRVLVAPAGSHLLFVKNNGQIKIKLTQDPLVNFVRPSIDVSMSSAVNIFGSQIIGVILTGMGKDGLEGSRKIKEAGGKIFVQDEESSVVWGMPGAVSKAGLTDGVFPLGQISDVLIKNIPGQNKDNN
jgi:two-component system, chemotaxis family, protein-glutamate methylesterase/glutaminase